MNQHMTAKPEAQLALRAQPANIFRFYCLDIYMSNLAYPTNLHDSYAMNQRQVRAVLVGHTDRELLWHVCSLSRDRPIKYSYSVKTSTTIFEDFGEFIKK